MVIKILKISQYIIDPVPTESIVGVEAAVRAYFSFSDTNHISLPLVK